MGYTLGHLIRDRAKQFVELMAEELQYDLSNLDAVAYGRAKNRMFSILENEIDIALSSNKEYGDYPAYREDLMKAFLNPEMIRVAEGRVYFLTEQLAGTESDFKDAVENAKRSLGLGEKFTGAQALWFWRVFIYGPAREGTPVKYKEAGKSRRKEKRSPRKEERDWYAYATDRYEKTISARRLFWAGKAPFWHYLNYGNERSKKSAFPTHGPTNFLEKALGKCQTQFETTLEQVENELLESNFADVALFLQNPETSPYKIAEVLARFEFEGRQFVVFVTGTRQLGVQGRRTPRLYS